MNFPDHWIDLTFIGFTPRQMTALHNYATKYARRCLELVAEQVPKPVEMVLHCPSCGMQHIDKPDEAAGGTNPPHRSHLCGSCGYIWRPADIATCGVERTLTVGKSDHDLVQALFTNSERSDLVRQQARTRSALERMLTMHEMLIGKINFASSFIDADTLKEMNEAPTQARRALEVLS
jgi:hypothetical protein